MSAPEQTARVLAALTDKPQTLADICDAAAPLGIYDAWEEIVGLCQAHKAHGEYEPARGCRVYTLKVSL